jgi:hypothetical protein
MTGLLVGLAVLAIVLARFLVGGRDAAREPTANRSVSEEIDYAELEQAEREVREAPDEESVRDWGPGVQKPPIA